MATQSPNVLMPKGVEDVVDKAIASIDRVSGILARVANSDAWPASNPLPEDNAELLSEASAALNELRNKQASRQENVSNAELQARRAYQNFKEEQGQAFNAYLGYLQGGSIVSHPTIEQLEVLHLNSQESSSLTELPALPAIIVAAAHLSASWSTLSFASRGVLMDSRFNSSITSSVSFDLP